MCGKGAHPPKIFPISIEYRSHGAFESEENEGTTTSILRPLLERINEGDEAAKEAFIQYAYPRALELTRKIMNEQI